MIVHFIATRHSIDINYTYLEKIISWGISPPENGSVKSVDLLNQSIVKMALSLQGQIKQSSLGILAGGEPMKCWIENIWLCQSLKKQLDRAIFSVLVPNWCG